MYLTVKKTTKKIIALIQAFILVAALGLGALAASPKTKNDGERHEVCDTLSEAAENYYADCSYDTLAGESAASILSTLRALMTNTHSYKSVYSDCRDLSVYTDTMGEDGRISLLYTSVLVTRDDFGGNTGTWNREHVWAKALGGFGNEGAGSDLHHIRPSDAAINNTRGDKKYGNVNGGASANGSSLVGEMTGGSYAGSYFEPLDNAKGDVARICLYVYARYGGEMSKCNDIKNVFESVDVLLEWCARDPVDEWEMRRNDVVEEIQGNRNVFIDYPEYAWLIFGEEIPENMVTPSGEAMSGEDVGCQHEYDDWDEVAGGDKMRVCALCGKVQFASELPEGECIHEFDEWDEVANGEKMRMCTICGEVEIRPIGDDTPPASRDEGAPSASPVVVTVIIAASAAVGGAAGVGVYCIKGRKKK